MATKFTVNTTPDLRSSQKGGLVGLLNSLFVAPLIRGAAAGTDRAKRPDESVEDFKKINVPLLGQYDRPITRTEQAKAIGGAGLSIATDILPMLKMFGAGGKAAVAIAKGGAKAVAKEGAEQAVKAGAKAVTEEVGEAVAKKAPKLAELPVPANITPIEQEAKTLLGKRMADPTGMIADGHLTPEAIDLVAKRKAIGQVKNVPGLAKKDSDVLSQFLSGQPTAKPAVPKPAKATVSELLAKKPVPKAQASSPKKPSKAVARQQSQPNVLLEIMQEADDLETMQLSGQDVSGRVQKLRERLMRELEQYPLETRPSLLAEFLQKTGEV